MIHICKKRKCPRRFSIGSETDSDHITYFCTECRKIYYYSNRRTKSVFLLLRLLILLFTVVILGYYLWSCLNKSTVDRIIDYGLESDSLTINSAIFPKLKNEFNEPFNLNFGQGEVYDSFVPDSVTYNKPGVYEIVFESDQISDRRKIIVYIPSLVPSINPPNKNKDDDVVTKSQPIEEEPSDAGDLKGTRPSKSQAKDVVQISEPREIKSTPEATFEKINNDRCANEGKPCDDNNANTEGDIIRNNCNCEGIPIVQIYYKDIDGDKLGDPIDSIEFQKGKAPKGKWVNNSDDKCPTRDGNGSADGCPDCSSELKTSKPLIDKQVLVSIDESSIKPSDVISWSGPPEIKFDKDSGATTSFHSNVVGKYTLNYSIKGADGFNKSCSINVCIEMTPDQMKTKLLPLLKYGMLSKGATGNFKSSANTAKEDVKRNLSKSNIMIYDEINSEINPFDTFMSADLMGSRGEIIDLEIINIRLNEDCKIDKIKIKLTRR